jgi:hypothetical protein
MYICSIRLSKNIYLESVEFFAYLLKEIRHIHFILIIFASIIQYIRSESYVVDYFIFYNKPAKNHKYKFRNYQEKKIRSI